MARIWQRTIPRKGTGQYLAVAALFASGVSSLFAAPLTVDDLRTIYTHAADRAAESVPGSVIAIVDRDGRALLVKRANGSGAVTAPERAIAVAKAGTAVSLSSNGEAFTSRTAGFIIQQNFPAGVLNRPPGPLVGVGFSSLAFSDINYFRELDGSRIPGTRLDGSPGGVPLYKDGVLVAAIGVTGDGTEAEDATITGSDPDEGVALAGQKGFEPAAEIRATNVYIDGISLPYVETEAKAAANASNAPFDSMGVGAPAALTWPTALIGGVAGQVRETIRGDPLPGNVDGQARLTEAEVRTILANAAARTLVTRGGIRLPRGQQAAVFITVVNNPAQAGVAPVVLGTFRTPDATLFSWDVAIQKARTAVFFSSRTRAFSTRTVGFLAEKMYPPGLANQPAGPFNGLQERFSIPLLSGTAGSNPNLPNGMTIFPGGFPLYRNGVVIGAIGVSGDGVDQDDLVAASGTDGFQPSPAIRADNMSYLGARLPYAKFPRDAELRPNVDPILSLPPGFQSLDVDPTAPISLISTQPQSHLVATGSTVVLSVGVDGEISATSAGEVHGTSAPGGTNSDATGASYQWNRNGVAIPGATSSQLLINGAQAGDAASYAVTVTNSSGAVTSSPAVLTVVNTSNPGRLINVSVRIASGTGEQVLLVGFVTSGGTSNKNLLIRGIGPTLTGFGVAGALADPVLEIIPSGTTVPLVSNDNWMGDPAVVSTGNALGAFALPDASSKDAALLASVPAGVYSARVSGKNSTTGIALAEIYDAAPSVYSAGTSELVNVSARAQTTNDNPLIAGFVVGGTTARTFLIRGVGPTLGTFGVGGAMGDPRLDIYRSVGGEQQLVASNDNWAGSSIIAGVTSSAGAFQMSAGSSNDAVVLVTLDPGVYSAKLTSAANTSGVALIEVYAIP